MCVRKSVCIYLYMCVRVCVFVEKQVSVRARVFVCVCMSAVMCVRSCALVYVRMYVHVCVFVCIVSSYCCRIINFTIHVSIEFKTSTTDLVILKRVTVFEFKQKDSA
jgi:hypothetical protein